MIEKRAVAITIHQLQFKSGVNNTMGIVRIGF